MREARGYWEWAPDAVAGDDCRRVMEEILSRPDMDGLSGRQRNFVRWVVSQSDGFLIPRFPLRAQQRIYPELKVYTPLERGDERERWHWHGDHPKSHWFKDGRPYIPDEEWPVYPPEAAKYGLEYLVGRRLPAKQVIKPWLRHRHGFASHVTHKHENVNRHDVHRHLELAKYLFIKADTDENGKPTERLASRIDVHPFVAEDNFAMLRDATSVWFCIEGCVKSDAILSWLLNWRGDEAALSVPAVGQWLAGPDPRSAGAELDFLVREFALDRKQAIYIVCDSDGFDRDETGELLKPEVRTNALMCREYLRERNVNAYVVAPPRRPHDEPDADGGFKLGADDALGGPLLYDADGNIRGRLPQIGLSEFVEIDPGIPDIPELERWLSQHGYDQHHRASTRKRDARALSKMAIVASDAAFTGGMERFASTLLGAPSSVKDSVVRLEAVGAVTRSGGPLEFAYRSYADPKTKKERTAPSGWADRAPVLYLNEEIAGLCWDSRQQMWQLENNRKRRYSRAEIMDEHKVLDWIVVAIQTLVADGWVQCAEIGCPSLFKPTRSNQHFCAEHRKAKFAQARWRDSRPTYVEIPDAQENPQVFRDFLAVQDERILTEFVATDLELVEPVDPGENGKILRHESRTAAERDESEWLIDPNVARVCAVDGCAIVFTGHGNRRYCAYHGTASARKTRSRAGREASSRSL